MKVQDPRSLSVVSALEAGGLIDPERRAEAVTVVDGALAGRVEAPEGMRQRLAELGGYVGGAFVVAAAALFVFQRWDTCPSASRSACSPASRCSSPAPVSSWD